MFKQLIDRARRLRIEAVPFDPSALEDGVATRTEWSPAKSGGASFRTHRLIEADSGRWEFRASPFAVVLSSIYLCFGIGLAAWWLYAPGSSGPERAIPMIVGLGFALFGGGRMWVGTAPIVFDKRRGEYWKGRVAPREVSNRQGLKHFTALDRVHALQIISERCRTKDSSYLSYELNLVLEDATRLNVIDHGNIDRLREDAGKLAAFLGKPVWDAAV